ncbi:MAG TPA: hypothetical protein VGH28_31775 [Polyangiaceae bacterium]|jgi:hypothetical protein
MTTKPHDDVASIALDARRVHDAAVVHQKNKEFSKRLAPHELAKMLADIVALEHGDGARTTTLHERVAAGVHVAEIRAGVLGVARDVKEDAVLAFPKDAAMQHAFGVGVHASPSSTREIRELAESLLAAAAAHPKEGAKIGLDYHGVHDLETMVHALDGADLAHVHAATSRHTNATHVDSLAHVVSAEASRIRRIAHRVLRDEPDALAAFARTLPRHAIAPRTHVTAPPAAVSAS